MNEIKRIIGIVLFPMIFVIGATAQQVTVTYNNPGNYSALIPTGATALKAEAWGGGGGGGTGTGLFARGTGGGGGGGAYTTKDWGNANGSMLDLSVGSGGAPSSGGGASTINYNSITVSAGGGGAGSSATASKGSGGSGGTASGGDGNINGGAGNNSGQGGNGGNGGAGASAPSGNATGGSGNPPGGGGGGGSNNGLLASSSGGPGADGKAIVTFNYSIATPSILGAAVRQLCIGDTLYIDNPVTDGGITYQWRKNGADIAGATGAWYVISSATDTNAVTYSVIAIANYTFSGASSISGDGTNNSTKTLSGVSAESAGVDVSVPMYHVSITANTPNRAWFYNIADESDETMTEYDTFCGSTVIPKHNAATGFHFNGYYNGSNEFLSSDSNYSFVLSSATDIKAVFDTNTYNIKFIAVREDGTPAPELGSTQGSGIYKHFTAASGIATENARCRFLYWRDSASNAIISYDSNVTIYPVEREAIAYAVFEEITFSVVTASNVATFGTTQGDSVYSSFIENTAIVSATPEHGYSFTEWKVSIDGDEQAGTITDNPYTIFTDDHIAHNYLFTAIFDTTVHTVSATATNGTVSGDGYYKHTYPVTLIATADSGYHFVNWKSNNNIVSDTAVISFTALNDTAFTAVFEVNTYPVTIDVTPVGYGTLDAASSTSGTYNHFDTLSLIANANAGYEFRYWVVNGDTVSINDTATLYVDGTKTIVGIFTPTRKIMTVTAFPSTYGTVSGSGTYEHGAAVTAGASSYYGFSFQYFINAANDTIYDNPIIISSLEQDTLFVAHFSRNNYRVEAPTADGGDVSMEAQYAGINTKEYPYESSVTIYAVQDSLHHFSHWSDREGNNVSTQNPLSILVERDTFYQANFERNQYTVSALVMPENAATVTGTGTYLAFDTATLTAVRTNKVKFDRWSTNGTDTFSMDSVITFEVFSNRNFFAIFSLIPFHLTVKPNIEERGTVSGSGDYFADRNTRISAVASYGYDFKCWLRESDTIGRTSTMYPVIRAQDDTVTAVFIPHNFTLTVIDGGTVEYKVPYRDSIEINTLARTGFDFMGWKTLNGNIVSTENEIIVTVLHDTLLEAYYTPKKYNITAHAENGGVSGMGEHYHGTTATLIATSTSERYVFSHWESAGGEKICTTPEMSVTVTGAAHYVAIFVPAPAVITLYSQVAGNVFAQKEINVKCFDTVSVVADSYTGLSFREWQNISTNSTLEINVLGDTAFYVIYDSVQYNLAVTVYPQNAGVANINGSSFVYGQTATLHAENATGYSFKNYVKKNGQIISYSPDYSFKVVASDSIIAQFTPNTYKVTVVSYSPTLGSVKGSKNALYGSIADIKAWATAYGYEFSAWKDGRDNVISNSAELSVTVGSDTTLYAHFVPSNFLLRVNCSNEKGSVSINGNDIQELSAPYLSNETIKATANTGYYFSGWKEDEKIFSTDTEINIQLHKNRTIEALFTPYVYSISLSSSISEATVYGAGTYSHGTVVNIKAEAPKAYNFIGWVDEKDDTVSRELSYSITVLDNVSLKAIFKLGEHSITLVENIAGASSLLQGDGVYAHNSNAVLRTEPSEKFKFLHWERNGVVLSSLTEFYLKVISSDTITAVFTPLQHQVNVEINISQAGVVSFSSKTFNAGDTVNIVAEENDHYHFLYWTENSEVVCEQKAYNFVATKSRNLVAHFEINHYKVTLITYPENVATLNGAGIYNALTTANVEAKKAVGYDFVGWINRDGDTLAKEQTLSIQIDKDTVLVALYISNTVMIGVIAEAGGTVTGGGRVPKGADTSVVAIPDPNYTFSHWTNEKNVWVSDHAEMSFIAERDATYTAHFIDNRLLPAAKLIAYPNPVKVEFNIIADKKGIIQIMDAKGLVMYDKNMSNYAVKFDCSALSSGVYIYRFIPDEGKPTIGKFIKY
ncbi:MAG: InlB B-repeat-containing protein [Bacteroidales bacterium]|jgi:hypothetical protein|nr:InlB B-repeat-containing protein [Bacteroidales bacterium]